MTDEFLRFSRAYGNNVKRDALRIIEGGLGDVVPTVDMPPINASHVRGEVLRALRNAVEEYDGPITPMPNGYLARKLETFVPGYSGRIGKEVANVLSGIQMQLEAASRRPAGI